MVTDITGSYYGGRRPLTFGMRAGQFRNSRASIFPSQTIINNNIGVGGGCYNYDYCDCGNSNKMSWMDWTMFGGVMLNGIGNFLSCFWGGGGGGSNGVEEKPVDLNTIRSDAAAVAKAYHAKKPTVTSDGTIRIEIDDEVMKFTNVDDMETALQVAQRGTTTTTANPATTTTTATPVTTTTTAPTNENPAEGVSPKNDFKELIGATYVDTQGNYDSAQGLKVGDKYYKTPAEAYKALTGSEPTQVTSSNTLNNILANIKGVWDGSEAIGDAPNATATLEQNKTYKSNDTIKIGSHTYKISTTTNGYVYLEAQNTSGDNNTQIYQLETYQDGNTTKYRLYQRENIAHGGADQGYNKAAF